MISSTRGSASFRTSDRRADAGISEVEIDDQRAIGRREASGEDRVLALTFRCGRVAAPMPVMRIAHHDRRRVGDLYLDVDGARRLARPSTSEIRLESRQAIDQPMR